jgi:large subunit ribosomal protein L10
MPVESERNGVLVARPEKVATVDEVQQHLEASAATLLTNYRGLSVSEMHQLRAELRKANATYRVAKNTLTRLAAVQAGMEGLEALLTGPTALVFCEDDPVAPAKAIKAFAKDHPALEFKGGYLDGAILSDEDALKLADLESREELIAKLAGLLYGALANFARLLQAPLSEQARLMQALIDDGGAQAKGFGSGEAEPAVAEAEPADEPTAEAADEPAAETADEPAAETADEPTAEAADEPAAETADEPAAESADEPVADETPAAESASDDSSESDGSSDSADSEDDDED